jgi:hypothetical protein
MTISVSREIFANRQSDLLEYGLSKSRLAVFSMTAQSLALARKAVMIAVFMLHPL